MRKRSKRGRLSVQAQAENGNRAGVHFNPLAVQLIAEHVASFMSFEQLKQCRLVCRAWFGFFTPVIRKQSFVTVGIAKEIWDLLDCQYDKDEYKENPHKQVRVKFPFLPGPQDFEEEGSLGNFWTTVGTTLTFLSVDTRGICPPDFLKDVMHLKTPNLRTLILTDTRGFLPDKPYEFHNTERWTDFEGVQQKELVRLELNRMSNLTREPDVDLLVRILLMYPKLKNLSVCTHFPRQATMYTQLVPVLTQLFQAKQDNPSFYQYEHLHLINLHYTHLHASNLSDSTLPEHYRIDPAFTAAFCALTFPLRTLTLDLGKKSDLGQLAAILESCKETLENLDVSYSGPQCNHLTWSHGLSTKLNILRLSGGLCDNLNFLGNLPKLQVLHVCGFLGNSNFLCSIPETHLDIVDGLNLWGTTNLLPEALKNLQEFRLDFDWLPDTPAINIGRCMPNLKTLILKGHGTRLHAVLADVLNQFQNLKELTIRIGQEEESRLLDTFPKLLQLEKVEFIPETDEINPKRKGVSKRLPFPDHHKISSR